MRLLLVRHGQSEGNVDELEYLKKGDCKVGLTDLGWQQAIRAGEFLGNHYNDTSTNQWPYVFVSAYQRTKETLSGVFHGLDGTFTGDPDFHEDPRLIEAFYGAMGRKRNPIGIVDPALAQELRNLAQHTYAVDKFTTRTLFGESKMDTYMRVRSFFEGTLAKKVEAGEDDFLIVAHGIVIQEALRFWGDLQTTDKIGNPNNCDVIEIIGDEPGKCSITKIYNGELMTPVHEAPVSHLKTFGLADLPAVPQHILNAMNP